MEDQGQDHGMERNEPVRSRWTPKPEQIVILESIFNSGMVNPPKDETVRIRKLLEPYGSVGDANVFYWFQNRRSRSRRRQRQIQASLAGDRAAQAHAASAIQYQTNLMPPSAFVPSSSSCLVGSSSSSCAGLSDDAAVDNLFSFSGQMGLQDMEHCSTLCSSNTSNLHYQSGNCMLLFFLFNIYHIILVWELINHAFFRLTQVIFFKFSLMSGKLYAYMEPSFNGVYLPKSCT